MIHWLAVGADPKFPRNINRNQTFYWLFSNRIGLPSTRALRSRMTHVRRTKFGRDRWKCENKFKSNFQSAVVYIQPKPGISHHRCIQTIMKSAEDVNT